jgi:hypothetical protein
MPGFRRGRNVWNPKKEQTDPSSKIGEPQKRVSKVFF